SAIMLYPPELSVVPAASLVVAAPCVCAGIAVADGEADALPCTSRPITNPASRAATSPPATKSGAFLPTDTSKLVTGLVDRDPDLVDRQRAVALDGDDAGRQLDVHVMDARELGQLLGDGRDAMRTGHAIDGVGGLDRHGGPPDCVLDCI